MNRSVLQQFLTPEEYARVFSVSSDPEPEPEIHQDAPNTHTHTHISVDEIHQEILHVLSSHPIPVDSIQDISRRLVQYKCVSTLDQIQLGAYSRFLDIRNPTQTRNLDVGGVVVEVKFLDSGTYVLVCKMGSPRGRRRVYQYRWDDYLWFQKMSPQELLYATCQTILDNEDDDDESKKET